MQVVLLRICICKKAAGDEFGQNLWYFRISERRRPPGVSCGPHVTQDGYEHGPTQNHKFT